MADATPMDGPDESGDAWSPDLDLSDDEPTSQDEPASDEELHEDERTVAALVELGIDLDDAVKAVDEGSVPLVLASKALDEPQRYTLRDLSEASGLDEAVLYELFSAIGVTNEGYTQSDLDAAHMYSTLLGVLPFPALLASARTRGMALSAVVRSDMGLVRDHILVPLREAGADDLAIAVALASYAKEFDRVSRRLLIHDYQRRIRQQLRSELVMLAARSDSPALEACVGFVDLVGYTALAARVDPTGLDGLLDAFEHRVLDAAAHEPGVTVVKFLGDAAMFVSSELMPLVDVLLRLTVPAGADDEVPIRGGIARGDVLMREGDYFGSPVNLAARLTDLARPWSLLADEVLREELAERYDLRRIRPVLVRGVGHRRPVAVRAPFDVTPSGPAVRDRRADGPGDPDASAERYGD